MFPRAGSDIFSFSENELTLKRSDLTAPSVAFDFQYSLLPQADVLFTAGWSHKAKQTELRHWDDNGAPIRQTTAMTEFPLTAGLKWYLVPRGRQIGHFAWVPTRAVPYVGIAGGAQHHSFKQSGLFVDAADSTIFNATYESSGWSGTVHLLGGVDVAVSRQAALRIEARYAWGSAGMGSDFENFSNLDLAGLQTTVGLSWRY